MISRNSTQTVAATTCLALVTTVFAPLASATREASDAPPAPEDELQSRYLELRVYQSKPNQRDRFLDHFEQHYLESQEATGMRIWGQFRDLDTPEHFVWMRGYADHERRPQSLMQFYTGSVWRETSDPIAEMLASAAHVHYLEPLSANDAFDEGLSRTAKRQDRGVVVAQLFPHDGNPAEVAAHFRRVLLPRYEAQGAVTLGTFRSSDEPNNFPHLPYITDEPVVAWIGSFPDQAAYAAARTGAPALPTPQETFVLDPGQRSRLYHRRR